MGLKRNFLETIEIQKIIIPKDAIKEEDHHLYEKLKKSIEARGQLKNIIVCSAGDGMYECLEGSKVIKILKELGEDYVNALNLGDIKDSEKNHVRIEISRDYFLTNYVQIGLMLKELSKTTRTAELCNTLPFTVRQCEHLINMSEFDWEQFNLNKQIEGQMSIFDVFDEVESEVDLQPWQKSVLEITKDDQTDDLLEKTTPQIFDEKTDPLIKMLEVDVEPEQQEEQIEDNPVLTNVFDTEVKEEEPQEVEIVFDLSIEPETVEVKEEKKAEDLNYNIVNEELAIYNHKTDIIDFLPKAAKKYLEEKYSNKTFEDVTIDHRIQDDVTYVKAVRVIADYGVTYNLKPEKWIEYLIEEIDPINNPFQQSLF